MKKIYTAIVWITLALIAIWLYIYFSFEQEIVNLVLINVIVYIIRGILVKYSHSIKNVILRYLTSLIVNIIWLGFVFWLLIFISATLFLAIISFLIIAISLTFRDRINNIASGVMIISSQIFEAGDLIQTNGVEGIVKEITLNYTKIKEFDGVVTQLPNTSIYGASVLKYTHRKIKVLGRKEYSKNKEIKQESSKSHVETVKKLITKEKKVTSYVKVIELPETVDPKIIDSRFENIFNKYEHKLGLRPTYNVNNTVADRCNISLRFNSFHPELVLENIDAFVREILFEINKENIYYGWEEYCKDNNISIPKEGFE